MAIIIVTNPTPRNCDNDSDQRHCSLRSASIAVTVTRTSVSASPRTAAAAGDGGGSSSKMCPFLWRCGSASTVSSSVVRHKTVADTSPEKICSIRVNAALCTLRLDLTSGSGFTPWRTEVDNQ